ncbi:mechanosensitive ion channel family protein [Solimonas marina]|uniref:Mechanosensing system component YbdG n=1 Tax=Solimonas marina TaxID=2714601 RepID=A0A970B662_9GAMM|nr:mechanosensitive ion channel family protein [Solimonas marina]
MEQIAALLEQPYMRSALGAALLVLCAWLADHAAKRLLLKGMRLLTRRTVWRWDDAFYEHGVFKRLAQMAPTLIIQFGIRLVPGVPDKVELIVRNIALAGTVLAAVLTISAVLNALDALYQATEQGRTRSIKGYVQLAKIVLFVVGAIVVIALLIDRSPLLLLSGLGAISAVLLLVFKDTILSLVASIQIASNDMLRVGDWITMPQFNADGDVIDIALHTVKVQNWDKTVTTIPTWRLISDSYKNWRGMQDIGARRIKRALVIDASSVRFLDDAEQHDLHRFNLLRDYLQSKREELARWNRELGEHGKVPVNQRRLTNLGVFRAYAQAYLQAHPEIEHRQTCMVRQLDPTSTGIPMEIYCFTATTVWLEYERIQSDIFDHLLAILPEFGMAAYQQPSGVDVRHALAPAGAGVSERTAPVQADKIA